ncbi:MAG: hypothetical protein AAFZ92_07605 [Pseudomonadota bacterium]
MVKPEHSVANMIDKVFSRYLSPKQKQWAWFVVLWFAGLSTVLLLGFVIRTAMGIS